MLKATQSAIRATESRHTTLVQDLWLTTIACARMITVIQFIHFIGTQHLRTGVHAYNCKNKAWSSQIVLSSE